MLHPHYEWLALARSATAQLRPGLLYKKANKSSPGLIIHVTEFIYPLTVVLGDFLNSNHFHLLEKSGKCIWV